MNYITTSKAQANIKKIEEFAKYLKSNYANHSKTLKTSENIDDIENSLAFVKDYAEVSEKLMEVINDYCKKNGMEL